MGVIQRITKLILPRKRIKRECQQNTDSTIYEDLGIVKPFTALAGEQFRSLIGSLSKNNDLKDVEREAFKSLWNAACIDIDGFGNNIWNLKEGKFTIYEKDDVKVQYEKKSEEIDKNYNQGRANFIYSSNNGNFIINQNERNKKVFLLYVSENISDRLLSILRQVEVEVLELNEQALISKSTGDNVHTRYSIDTSINQDTSYKTRKTRKQIENEEIGG